MRQVPNDKYTVTWCKLAEFIARGERERALGLYKLLFHSFRNNALALQLEGDILLSFNDIDNAIDRYVKAAKIYLQEGKKIEAIALYEHILFLQPNDNSIEVLTKLKNKNDQ